MNAAVLRPQHHLRPMQTTDLDEVLALERSAYEFPWSRGNFIDSLHAGYHAQLLVDERDRLIGYVVAMAGVDEMHLLNLSVAPAWQRLGHARGMLDALLAHCREAGAAMLWLEVRTSNARARELYRRYGFAEIGVRRNYYPAPRGTREDAVVMSLATAASAHG
jgi:[ribosomal protein S18]-alanine N-acetyltransferase